MRRPCMIMKTRWKKATWPMVSDHESMLIKWSLEQERFFLQPMRDDLWEIKTNVRTEKESLFTDLFFNYLLLVLSSPSSLASFFILNLFFPTLFSGYLRSFFVPFSSFHPQLISSLPSVILPPYSLFWLVQASLAEFLKRRERRNWEEDRRIFLPMLY
jgi:hypothetical protein